MCLLYVSFYFTEINVVMASSLCWASAFLKVGETSLNVQQDCGLLHLFSS